MTDFEKGSYVTHVLGAPAGVGVVYGIRNTEFLCVAWIDAEMTSTVHFSLLAPVKDKMKTLTETFAEL